MGSVFWAGIGTVAYALGGDEFIALVGDGDVLALSCREVFARGGRPVEVAGPYAVSQAVDVHEGFWRRSTRGETEATRSEMPSKQRRLR